MKPHLYAVVAIAALSLAACDKAEDGASSGPAASEAAADAAAAPSPSEATTAASGDLVVAEESASPEEAPAGHDGIVLAEADPHPVITENADPQTSREVAPTPASPSPKPEAPRVVIHRAPHSARSYRPEPPRLAYVFRYGLEAPVHSVRDLMEMHQAACVDAGPAVCQVLGQSLQSDGRARLDGELTLRATPRWMRSFRDEVEDQTRSLGGRIASSGLQTEEISASQVRTDGRLAAAVRMQKLHISYRSAAAVGPGEDWTPLASTWNASLGAFGSGLILLLQAAIWLAPWVGLGALGVWLYRRTRKPAAAVR